MDTPTDRSIAKLTEKTWAVFLGDEQIGTIEKSRSPKPGIVAGFPWAYAAFSTEGVIVGCNPSHSLNEAADQLVSWFTADELHGNKV